MTNRCARYGSISYQYEDVSLKADNVILCAAFL